MGSESLTTMVAGDSSFMIKTLYTFKLNGVSLNIDTTHVALLLVSVFILVMAVIARIKINKVDASDTPGMFQNVIEIIVEMLGTMVDGIMGKNANKFVNYISTLFLFIIISNISGLFGLRPPTADYGVTLCLGLKHLYWFSLMVSRRTGLSTLQHYSNRYGFYSRLTLLVNLQFRYHYHYVFSVM